MNAIALATLLLGDVVEPEPACGGFDQVSVPVRVFGGAFDIPHIQTRCARLAAALPDGRLDILGGAGHLPSLEQPKLFTERLLTVLADLDRPNDHGAEPGP